jgi:SAM-dependent methyltransferase
LIEEDTPLAGCDLLEIGAGAGIISSYMAYVVGPAGSVTAIDVVDERVVRDGYRFMKVHDAYLPLPDGSFDVVISNHVIEHVGDRQAQRTHLEEIQRVLRPGGVLYLAAPNRWALIEPHYKLFLLSWPPAPLRDRYFALMGKGDRYDCNPMGPFELTRLVRHAGFACQQKTSSAMRIVREVEPSSALKRLLLGAPEALLRLLYPLAPTVILIASAVQSR